MTSIPLFIIACALLIILPGPDTAVVTKNTIVYGQKSGLQTMLGVCCGLLIHTAACIAGLSALIVQSALAFTILKYVGAAYLCYLGVKTLLAVRSQKQSIDAIDYTTNTHTTGFKQGFLTNITNPKVAVFFLTFLPQFLANNTSPFWPFLTMGIIYAVLTLIWFIFYVLLLDKIRAFMQRPTTMKVTEALTGIVLIGFGIKLALEKVSS